MNSRELIDQMNHDRQREAAPSSTAVSLYVAAITAALYCITVFLFTA
jgi:hypothetical protein